MVPIVNDSVKVGGAFKYGQVPGVYLRCVPSIVRSDFKTHLHGNIMI